MDEAATTWALVVGIDAQGFPGQADQTPNPAVALVACFAASQDQRAAELHGRGAFVSRMLAALDLDNPWQGAVDLDFFTGVRTVDMSKLVLNYVKPMVEAEF